VNPLVKDVHVQTALPNFSRRRSNHAFVGTRVAPLMRVTKETDKFFTFGDEHFRIPPTHQGERGLANEVDYSLSTDSYTIKAHGLRIFVPDRMIRNADNPLNPIRNATMHVQAQLDLSLEDAIATLMATSGNFGDTTTLTGSNLWSDASSDPVGDMQTAVESVKNLAMVMPNWMLIGNAVWPEVRHHPQILDRIKYQGTNRAPAQVSLAAVSELMEIPNVFVGPARKRTDNEGAASEVLANVWDDDVFIGYSLPNVRPEEYSWAKVFHTTRGVRRYRDEAKGQGGVWVEVNFNYIIKVVAANAAYAIYNAV